MADDRTKKDGQRRGMSGEDEDRALDALDQVWAGQCDEIWVYDGEWGAHRADAARDDVITAASPDELDAALRADLSRRGMQAPAAGSSPTAP